jgi:octaprenyl-diphosphate synthase
VRLDRIIEPITQELEMVRAGLGERLEKLVARQNLSVVESESIRHIFASPGKLIRPALVFLSARATGGAWGVHLPALVDLAIAAELVHTASLIHDDIVDGAVERRGLESLNRRFGSAVAVLAGDVLYAEFFMTLLELPGTGWEQRGDLFRRFAQTTQRMCIGEMHEHRIAEGGMVASEDDYLQILERKTADLMSVCCASAAIACDSTPRTVARLQDFGMAFGMAFQLVDDALDGDALFGSARGAVERARGYIEQAERSVGELPAGEGTVVLRDLCGYLLERAGAGVDRL